MSSYETRSLDYHQKGRRGKIEVRPTKPCYTQDELSLAYTPGVAGPCKEIAEKATRSYRYTARGNLVGVITNGTAVLGLGNIGPYAAKPVMEGKSVLFKLFADIDCFDIEINESDPQKFVEIVRALEPTFGGLNLEDVKAPDCFYIEQELRKTMKIPVFHDDQHGTAIICTAALINALEVAGKKANQVKVVFSGAGAAGVACAKMFMNAGVEKQNIFLVDRQGLVIKNRPDLEVIRGFFAQDSKPQSLSDVMKDADVFVGVSNKDLVSPKMLKTMTKNPIVFAMANPDPEIAYPLAIKTRSDIIMATGRSDYPNQVNNVLGFPYIMRGTLDAQAITINEEMKMAASRALAELARKPVPAEVKQAYHGNNLVFGPHYLIPTPLDPRILPLEASAVAQAAIDSGVAGTTIENMDAYVRSLEAKAYRRFEKNLEDTQKGFGLASEPPATENE